MTTDFPDYQLSRAVAATANSWKRIQIEIKQQARYTRYQTYNT